MPLAKAEVDSGYDAKMGVSLRFHVKITSADAPEANLKYWSAVSGIKQTIKVIPWAASDGVSYQNQLPGMPEPGKVTLTRAITEADTKATFKWLHDFQKKHSKKGSMMISGFTAWGDPAGVWTFTGVWPCSWTGPTFGTTKNEVATEQLELVHDGLLQAAEGGHEQG